eukprot:TRINITY_DN51843_c0_g1_i4.p1 TRINITY_DN51843_c0_g1~~TRINITY_DN51843_c0_g1_i4.p1  ORF type:complete len:236 (+),score=-16.84 TRINITY_DN51843_c0_g1_i4:144-851(+)
MKQQFTIFVGFGKNPCQHHSLLRVHKAVHQTKIVNFATLVKKMLIKNAYKKCLQKVLIKSAYKKQVKQNQQKSKNDYQKGLLITTSLIIELQINYFIIQNVKCYSAWWLYVMNRTLKFGCNSLRWLSRKKLTTKDFMFSKNNCKVLDEIFLLINNCEKTMFFSETQDINKLDLQDIFNKKRINYFLIHSFKTIYYQKIVLCLKFRFYTNLKFNNFFSQLKTANQVLKWTLRSIIQ